MLGFVGFNQTLNARRTSLQIKLQWINIQLWSHLHSDILFSFFQVPSSYRDSGKGKKASCECILFRNIPEWSILKFVIGSNSHFTPIISMKPLYEKIVIQYFSSSMENKIRYLEERKISSVISTELFSQSVITRKHIEHSFANIF